jgi:integrase
MAWLEQSSSGLFHLAFRFEGQKFKKSLHTRDARSANARLHRIDENIRLIESGRLVVPEDADVGSFLLSDGKLNGAKSNASEQKLRSLRQYSAAFLASIPNGSLEPRTIKGMKTHLKHLERVIGGNFIFTELRLDDLQNYVDRRSDDPGIRGKKLSPATIKKEITTLRSLWNWARNSEYIIRALPVKGLRYPKMTDKPPFQTLEQIERRLSQLSRDEDEENELWSSLFFTTYEVHELLEYVRVTARHSFIYPIFVFAAHTGARRSEILRSRLDDIDFGAGTITIHEKKRVRGRHTTRSVPMSPLLRKVLREWIPSHPGGSHTFVLSSDIDHSKRKGHAVLPVTHDQAHDYFKRALEGSKWEKARGWHVFRHSFCSNCASAGIDQRLINAWVGHQTEEMVKRYRHLVPDQQQKAIAEVFNMPAK